MSALDALLQGYKTIQNAGVAVTARNVVNFTGSGFTITDDSANGRTTINLTGGGGSVTWPLVVPTASTATINQAQAASGAGGTFTLQAQAAATGSNAAGGNVVIQGGAKDGSGADGFVSLYQAATLVAAFASSGITMYSGGVTWNSAVGSPTISQSLVSTNSTNGQALTVQAQNATGLTSTGGALNLTSGTGTTAAGNVNLQLGGTTKLAVQASQVLSFLGTVAFDGSLGAAAIGINQKSGTGANVGANLQIIAQAGQQQTGGAANNNGGILALQGGVPGTGGSGAAGLPGAVQIYTGTTQVASFNAAAADFLALGPMVNGLLTSPTGLLRLANNTAIYADGNAAGRKQYVIGTDSFQTLLIADNGSNTVQVSPSTSVSLAPGGTTELQVTTTICSLKGAGTEQLRVEASGIAIGGGAGSYGGGTGVAFMANRTAAPTSNPTGGGILYAEAGALKWRGSSGTTTTIAPA